MLSSLQPRSKRRRWPSVTRMSAARFRLFAQAQTWQKKPGTSCTGLESLGEDA